MKDYRYFVPTEVIAGGGVFGALGEQVRRLGERPLVVTGRHSARVGGTLDRALAQLSHAVVFDAIDENPTSDVCRNGADICRAHACDVVVGIGGGSAMDAAKAVAVLARNEGTCADYFGADKYPHRNLPVVAVPTTAGTGSEVTPYAVIVDSVPPVKRTITGRGLFPVVALLDPALSVSMPRAVTISTGLDALSQAMEGMVSLRSTPVGDALALETCRCVRHWLPRAVASPADLEARSQMLFAAMLSGCVIAHSGTTLVHGMGYYFTLEWGLSHGFANALLLTPLFRFNARQLPGKVAAIAGALGYPGEPGAEAACRNIAQALHTLLDDLGISPAARDAGVEMARLRACAEDIFADRSRFKNQAGEPTLDEVHQFFLDAYSGADVHAG